MYKALLVALIGLFFSLGVSAQSVYEIQGSYYDGPHINACKAHCSAVGSTFSNNTANTCRCYSGGWVGMTLTSCSLVPSEQRPPSCPPPEDTENFCKDGSIAPNGDFGLCPKYTCADGQVVDSPSYCSTPFECPDGSTPPNNSVANCPVNCDILNGGGGPECDVEEPDDYCSETQSPVFDDCQYGPDDPRNPENQPDPDDHCEQFPDSVSCDTELPPLPESDYCKQYPTSLSCQTPEVPELGGGTNTSPLGPPPAGGTGSGTDTGTPTPPPPAPPPINSGSSSASTDSRLDNLRYDIAKLHSGLNYQTNVIARGLTGVGKQLQANGGKIDRSNTLLDGINKNLDTLNGSLKGAPLTEGNFNVEGGINSALGITGNESVADLTNEPVRLQDYRDDFQPFLTVGQCPVNLPVALSLFGSDFNFVFYYQPVCDLMGVIGSILNWAVWLSVPFIVFGRRRAS